MRVHTSDEQHRRSDRRGGRTPLRRAVAAAGALAVLTGGTLLATGVPAAADGTEQLGTPSLNLATGSGMAVASVGMFVQPATLQVTIPADATVTQAILYFEAGHQPGDTSGEVPDSTIRVNGIEFTGTTIGGPTPFYGSVVTSTQRVDLTSAGLVGAGTTTLTLDGLDTDEVADGAGLVVLYRRSGAEAQLGLRDGNDIAFADFASPRDTTAPQTFRFDPAPVDRTATVVLLVSSIHDPAQTATGNNRPHALAVTSGGRTVEIANPFVDRGGREFDDVTLEVSIPANASEVTLQLLSRRDDSGDLPASLVWVAAGLSVPQPAPRITTESLVPTTTSPTTTAPTTTAVPPTSLPRTESGQLAFTGRDSSDTAAAGTALLAIGTVILLATRRHRRRVI